MNKVLILTDGKAGHENQSKAFARALGLEFDIVETHFRSKAHKALSYLFDHLGLLTLSLFDSALVAAARPNAYVAVLGTGSGTFYAVKAMARRLGVPCGVVLYPRGYRLATFDCILAPAFDDPESAANVVVIPANLVANDAAFYEKGVAAFRERCEVTPEVSVIIGGPNKCSTMTAEWMKGELDRLFASEPKGTRFAVTTSRRTPAEIEALVDSYPWAYRLIYSRDHFNPIPAFVQLSKKLYVTAESTGMLSEACTFGAASVFALDNLKPGPHKFRRFTELLREGGYLDGSRKIDLTSQFAAARALLRLS